jgi:ribosome-binding protein aMBF1 (putative translation factor)
VLREAKRLSGPKLARAVGISPSYLWRVEVGERVLGEDLTLRIAEVLGVDFECLTGQIPPYRAIRQITSTKSFEDFAASIGMPTAELADIEDGVVEPSKYVVGSLATRLGIFARDLEEITEQQLEARGG